MRLANEASIGGHAVCLVGYQDDGNSPGGGYFIVRNSWDSLWATESPYGIGYGVIPYQYITNDATEAYTATISSQSDEKNNRIESERAKNVVIEVGDVRITISSPT